MKSAGQDKRNLKSIIHNRTLHYRNYMIIDRFVENECPDLLVICSDLGDLYIRFLIEICHLRGIPVLIFITGDVLLEQKRPSVFSIKLNESLFRIKSRFPRYIRARIFSRTLLGTFSLDSKICVLSEDGRNKLIQHGLNPDRIIVTKYKSANIPGIPRKDFCDALNIPEDKRIITIFTECIHEVYGKEYLVNLNKKFMQLFSRMDDRNLFIIIKLHPRENEEIISLFSEIFKGPGMKVVGKIGLDDLILQSELCIAHYSTVLMTAAIMKKDFLSINIKGERQKTFIPEQLSDILEIKSHDEIEKKIARYLDERDYRDKVHSAIGRLEESFGGARNRDFKSVVSEYFK